MSLLQWVAVVVVFVTLVGVAVGRYPWLRMNRATIALVGATALMIVGAIAEVARGRGVELSFREYLRTGPIITLFSLVLGVLWLSLIR